MFYSSERKLWVWCSKVSPHVQILPLHYKEKENLEKKSQKIYSLMIESFELKTVKRWMAILMNVIA